MIFSNLYQNIQLSGHVIFSVVLSVYPPYDPQKPEFSLFQQNSVRLESLEVLLLLIVKGITTPSNPNPSLSGEYLFLFPL